MSVSAVWPSLLTPELTHLLSPGEWSDFPQNTQLISGDRQAPGSDSQCWLWAAEEEATASWGPPDLTATKKPSPYAREELAPQGYE